MVVALPVSKRQPAFQLRNEQHSRERVVVVII